MPFEFKKQEIEGVVLIIPTVFSDERGSFLESFKTSEFQKHNIPTNFKQENHSISNKNVLRGLHFQIPPKAQGKLVRVSKGKLIDMVVDIRKSSPSYGKAITLELNDQNHHMLYIPEGCAHGVLALEDKTHLIYKLTEEYSPEHERGISVLDKELNIKLPVDTVVIAKRDKNYPMLKEIKKYFE